MWSNESLLRKANNPIMICDFSIESMLMLHYIRTIRDIALMVFPACWKNKYPLEVIEKMELTAFFQKPFYVTGDIAYYNIEGHAVPLKTAKPVKAVDVTPKWNWDYTIIPNTIN